MCGIVGVAGKLEIKDEALMRRLLLFDFFRGPDSTGLAAITNSGEVKIAKLPSHPIDLFDSSRFKAALSGSNSKVFIGHNRAATRGIINHRNTHPFQYEHIVGVHNGTLDYLPTDDLEAALGEKYPVDSEALIAGIARFGIEETIKMLTGAWSLVWYNTSDGTLNFLRNDDRPMWYAYSAEFDKIFWASEHEIIDSAIRSGVGYKMHEEGKEKYRYFATEPDIWYSFDVNVLKAGGKARPKPKAKEVKGKVKVVPPMYSAASSSTGGSGAHDPFQRTGTGGNNGSGGSTQARKPIHLIGDHSNPMGGAITRQKYDDIVRYGCGWCEGEMLWGDTGITIFERDEVGMCTACSGDAGNTRVYTKHLIGA